MSKIPRPQIAAHLSQTLDAPPRCSRRPVPAGPPWSPDHPSSAIPSTPPVKADATGPQTCPSDRRPSSKLLSTLVERRASPPVPLCPLDGRGRPSLHQPRLRDCRSQHALSAIPPPAPQDSESATTRKTS